MPCRDAERKTTEDFLRNGLQNKGCSTSLYISGMPGTGKTATTLEVIKKLKRSKLAFDFLHINGMSLTNPNLVYTVICENIIGRRFNPATAAAFLDEFFKKKDKIKVLNSHLNKGKKKNIKLDMKSIAEKTRVLLIDELDALITKKQTLLYNLFDWPCHQNSKLLVIAIANTMDLPERFNAKIKSRIGNTRVVYEPYSRDQIKEILESRLKGIEIFEQKSIQLVAAKVSTYSGDIRRGLQLTKRTVEIVRDRYLRAYNGDLSKPYIKVNIGDVNEAYNELYHSKNCQVLRSLRQYEVLVVIAMFLEKQMQGTDKILLEKVQDRVDNMLTVLEWKYQAIPTNVFREIVKRLHSFGLVSLQFEPNKIIENVYLLVFIYYDEIKQAFEKHEVYQRFEAVICLHAEGK